MIRFLRHHSGPALPPVQAGILLWLMLGTPALPAAEAKVRVDAYGDPLPAGAIARLGSLRLRQMGLTLGAAFSPDGKVLATTEWQNGSGIHLWDTDSGKEIRHLAGLPADQIVILKFSPTGQLLAGSALREEHTLFLWDTATGKLTYRLHGKRNVRQEGFAFTNDGKSLVAVDARGVTRWWSVASGAEIRSWKLSEASDKPNDSGTRPIPEIEKAALTPDARLLLAVLHERNAGDGATEGNRNSLELWDLEKGKRRWRIAAEDRYKFFNFDFSSDGKVVAVCIHTESFPDHRLSLRDGITGRELRRMEHSGSGYALSRDGRQLAMLNPGSPGIQVWSTSSNKIVQQIASPVMGGDGLRLCPRRLFFSPDGKRLLVVWYNTLTLLDVVSGKERPRFQGHRTPVHFLGFSADGKTLVSGDEGNWPAYPLTAITWDTTAWRETARSELASYKYQLSRDHRLHLLVDNGELFVVYHASGKRLRQMEIHADPFLEYGSFSPSGRTIVSEINKHPETVLLDVASGKRRGCLPKLASRIFLAFTPDDRLAAWVDFQGVLHVAAVDDGKEMCRLGTPRASWYRVGKRPFLTFAPDGHNLAFWDPVGGEVVVWCWPAGRERLRLKLALPPARFPLSPLSQKNPIALAFSADGRCLAVGGRDKSNDVEVWELASGKMRRRLTGHQNSVLSLAFSLDGRLLASGSCDTTILIWDLFGLSMREQPRETSTTAQSEALWTDLADADAGRADAAITALIQQPAAAATLLKQKLPPAAATNAGQLRRLIAGLDSDDFAQREKATHELTVLAERAEPALRKALKEMPSPEMQRRIQRLLGNMHRLSPERLRLVRAVEVLEQLRTPEARRLLERLASGAPAALLTREARASLLRLTHTAARK